MERNERLVAIGSRIREKMVSEGHTITSLAERSGMTKSTLGRILQGEGQSLDIAAHERIAVSLGVSFSDLIAIEKPLFPKLLGVKAIDQLLWQFYGLLYQGEKGLKSMKSLVTDQYRLSYLQEDYNAAHAKQLSILEEIRENEKIVIRHGGIAVEPTQAWIAGKAKVLCYTRTLSRYLAHEESTPPNNLDMHQTNTIDLIKFSDHFDNNPAINTLKIAHRSIAVTQSVSRIG